MLALAVLILIGTLTEQLNYKKQKETALKLCGNAENIAYVDSDTVICKQEELTNRAVED